ncbi:MAG: hypothetical protein U5J96_17320 [Ignavibacteriaceae bacterium]|nr:hypothetical protein [Ignavibacteriaceae bacterium]
MKQLIQKIFQSKVLEILSSNIPFGENGLKLSNKITIGKRMRGF